GKLDINANGLVVDHSAGSDAASLTSMRTQLAAGYNNGDWQGNGITSSTVAAAPNHGIGYGLASDLVAPNGGEFMGATVDGSSVVARETILGDANLDGTVAFPDLVRLAQNYNSTNATWAQGDFSYD